MITHCAFSILNWVRGNVARGEETLGEVRTFVHGLEGLTDEEHLFLDCALRSRSALDEFHATFARPGD